jgi:hypothetical protein
MPALGRRILTGSREEFSFPLLCLLAFFMSFTSYVPSPDGGHHRTCDREEIARGRNPHSTRLRARTPSTGLNGVSLRTLSARNAPFARIDDPERNVVASGDAGVMPSTGTFDADHSRCRFAKPFPVERYPI